MSILTKLHLIPIFQLIIYEEDQHLHYEYRTGGARLGKGLQGRDDPNLIVDTKFIKDLNEITKVRCIEGKKYESNKD